MNLSQNTEEMRSYMSVEELSRYTGVSVSTWNKRRVSGNTPAYLKIGRLVRYSRKDVDNWLRERETLNTSDRA